MILRRVTQEDLTEADIKGTPKTGSNETVYIGHG